MLVKFGLKAKEFEEFMKDESFENDFMHFMSLLDNKIKVE